MGGASGAVEAAGVVVGAQVGELGGGVGEQLEDDDQDGALQRDQGLGLGHPFDQPAVAFPQEGVGLRGAHSHLGQRGFEVGVAFTGACPAGLAPGLHGAGRDLGPGTQPLRGAEHRHVQPDLAEDGPDRVRAGAGDRAHPRDGRADTRPGRSPAPVAAGGGGAGGRGRVGGVGAGRALIAASSRSVTWVIRAVSSSSWPSSIRASRAWWSVNRPSRASFQSGAAGAGPAPGQLGQYLRAALPGDQRLDHRPAGDAVDVGEHRGDLDQGVLEQLLDPLLDPGAVLDQVEPGPGQIPHLAHRLGGHQRRGHHRPLGQLGQPHRVDLVGLRATRDVLAPVRR